MAPDAAASAFATPAPPMTGRVLAVETGVAVVRTLGGVGSASWSGELLARVARNRAASPRPGDLVELDRWPDGRVTIRRTVPQSCATVVPLR